MAQYFSSCHARGDLQNKKTRGGLISLMRTVSFRLREDPTLLPHFFNPTAEPPDFLLFKALLTFLNSDHEDGHNAREGLLCLIQLPDERLAQFLANQTPSFCELLVFGIKERYEKLPKDLTPFLPLTPATAALLTGFGAWIDLLNVVAQTTFKVVAERVTFLFQRDFLRGVLRPALLDAHPDGHEAIAAMFCLKQIIDRVDSALLQNTIVSFVLGDNVHECEVEDLGGVATTITASESTSASRRLTASPPPGSAMGASGSIGRALVARLGPDVSVEMARMALGVCDALLLLRDPGVIQRLVLRNLRGYRFLPVAERAAVLERGEIQTFTLKEMCTPFPAHSKAVNRRALETYLVDAHTEGQLWLQSWDIWEASKASVASTASASSPASPPTDEVPFFEGAFLRMLLLRLSALHTNPFSVNLAVTGLLAKLCHCPHPAVHAYLFDPTLYSRMGALRLLSLGFR
jgi:hypothetical protein